MQVKYQFQKIPKKVIDKPRKIPALDSLSAVQKEKVKKINEVPIEVESSQLNAQNSVMLECEAIVISEKKVYTEDSFCEAFFISGIPQKNAQIIPKSENYPAPCMHKTCSILPSYKTEIISRFPQSDKNKRTFEINQITSSLCFPYGIKICYNQKESLNIPPKNFFTVATNEKGELNYVYVYNIFQKVDMMEYQNTYDADPVKGYFLKGKVVSLIDDFSQTDVNSLRRRDSIKKEKEIDHNLQTLAHFLSSDYVYLPVAVCLVSKYPYTTQMEMCIEAFLRMATVSKNSQSDLFRYLKHLIFEIPTPPINHSLEFYIPTSVFPIEIPGPLHKNLPIRGSHFYILFNYFSIEMIITIHNLMVFEQKLLFVCNEYDKLTEITQAFIHILYPLSWCYTYIPILSDIMIKFLQSFMPFIMGIDEFMLNLAKEYFDEESNVTIIIVKDNAKSIMHTSNEFIQSKKKSHTIPDFPQILKQELYNDLKTCKKLKEKIHSSLVHTMDRSSMFRKYLISHGSKTRLPEGIPKNPHYSIEKFFRKSFIYSMIRLFGDNKKFVVFIDELAYFNQSSFLDSKPDNQKAFFQEMTCTGMFRAFIQLKVHLPYFSKLCLRYTNSKTFDLAEPTSGLKDNLSYLNKQNSVPSSMIEIGSTMIRRSMDALLTKKNSDNNIIHYCQTETNSSSRKENINAQLDLQQYRDIYPSEYMCSYFVPPYFIEANPLILKDLKKLEKYLHQFAYQTDSEGKSISVDFSTRIFTFDFHLIFEIGNRLEFNRYFIPEQGFLKRRSSNRRSSLNELLLTCTNKEVETLSKLKELIEESMKQILTGEIQADSFDKKELRECFISKLGRHFFSRIIYQAKFRERKTHVLNKLGFEKIIQMIFAALLHGMNDSREFESVRLITKNGYNTSFRVFNHKEVYYLYEEFARKKPFEIWQNDSFWTHWFLQEVKERQKDNENIPQEEFYFMILLEIGATMTDLNIEIKTQLNCVIEKIARKYILQNPELLATLETTLIRQHKSKEKEKEFLKLPD